VIRDISRPENDSWDIAVKRTGVGYGRAWMIYRGK